MSVEVVMPQMGESITEGTVSKWLKQVGERVEKDEGVLEISTDKVDAEVPSPGAGTLLEILVNEGETVEVGSVLARVGSTSGVAAAAPAPTPVAQPSVSAAPPIAEPKSVEQSMPQAKAASAGTNGGGNGHATSLEELR